MESKNLQKKKQEIIEKAQRAIRQKYEDYTDDQILSDYFDDAVNIIVKWRKLKSPTEIENGYYDTEIKEYIVNRFNQAGVESSYSYSGGYGSNVFFAQAETILKSKIPQVL